MANRPTRPHLDENDYDDEYWDGTERRGCGDDRRQRQVSPRFIPQYYQYYQMPPQQPQSVPVDKEKNVANTTLTLSQIGVLIVAAVGIISSLFNVWNNMSKQIDDQKNAFEQFKIQISRDVTSLDKTVGELKKSVDMSNSEVRRTDEEINKRIQELDATVSQLYQKVSRN